MGQTVASTIRKKVADPRVAQMLDHFTQYVGSCPDNAPAVLCSIAHMQTEGGVWYPMGGTRAVPEALCKPGTRFRVVGLLEPDTLSQAVAKAWAFDLLMA